MGCRIVVPEDYLEIFIDVISRGNLSDNSLSQFDTPEDIIYLPSEILEISKYLNVS